MCPRAEEKVAATVDTIDGPMNACAGVELFQGTLRQQCFFEPSSNASWSDVPAECPNVNSEWCNGTAESTELLCGGLRTCPLVHHRRTVCRRHAPLSGAPNRNPAVFKEFLSFDDFASAALMLTTVLTLSGWAQLMHMYENTYHYFGARVFFVVIMLVGNLCLINVALAVVTDCYLRVWSDQCASRHDLRSHIADYYYKAIHSLEGRISSRRLMRLQLYYMRAPSRPSLSWLSKRRIRRIEIQEGCRVFDEAHGEGVVTQKVPGERHALEQAMSASSDGQALNQSLSLSGQVATEDTGTDDDTPSPEQQWRVNFDCGQV